MSFESYSERNRRSMQVIEVEAGSLEEARERIKSQIPEGLQLLSVKIISDGRPRIVRAVADTTEAAFIKAQKEIPNNADILEKKEIIPPEWRVITMEASNEQLAELHQAGKTVKRIKLVTPGKKGFLGIGRKPNQYEVEIVQQATVEISYKPKAKISVDAGEAYKPKISADIILIEAFLTPDDCLDFITRSAIGDIGVRNDVTVFVITARGSSTLEHAHAYLQKSLPRLGFDNKNIHLLELTDEEIAQQQMYKLKTEISATPFTKRVILGKGFYGVCPDLLTVGRDSYNAMVILRELAAEDQMRRIFSIVNNHGLAEAFCSVFIDLETDASRLITEEYRQLEELLEYRSPALLKALPFK